MFVRGQWEVLAIGNKQRVGIRRTALECLEHYELIIRRIRNLCADFDSKDLIDPGSMGLQLRLLFIDSASRSGGRSVMNLIGGDECPEDFEHRSTTNFCADNFEYGFSWVAGQ